MSTDSYVFTSESVSMGHPDKIADQVSDAVLDAMLSVDPNARVACETMVTTGMVVVAGEVARLMSRLWHAERCNHVLRAAQSREKDFDTGASSLHRFDEYETMPMEYNHHRILQACRWAEDWDAFILRARQITRNSHDIDKSAMSPLGYKRTL